MLKLLKNALSAFRLYKGLKNFQKTGITTLEAYSSLRQMFVMTKGTSNDKISAKIAGQIGKYKDLNYEGVLRFESRNAFKEAVTKMRLNGYYIFENKLAEQVVNDIYEIAKRTPCSYLNTNTGGYEQEKIIFDQKNPLSPRYEIDPADVVNYPSIQKLIFDPSLLAFAQEYLGVKPILDLIAFWWSIPYQGKGKSGAAQMYHFDLDRIKFMKFFFYLTDVETDTGPHCYVKRSHTSLPKAIDRDGRFSDEEIEHIYGVENLIEICGGKGTIMAVDTRGFHKGKELLKDKRLLFQIEFANSMFGQTYPPIKIKFASDDIIRFTEKYAYTYKQILID